MREQRLAVFARLGLDARPAWLKSEPGLAAAAVLVAGILLVRPSGAPVVLGARHIAVVENPSADAQFFQDIAALDDSPEPQAAIVASGLFQQQ